MRSPHKLDDGVDWRVVFVEPGTVADDSSPIAEGWYVVATGPDDPEDVRASIHVEFAVGPDGELLVEQMARAIAWDLKYRV